jgi:peptide/nickel transport system ATP-binding protein
LSPSEAAPVLRHQADGFALSAVGVSAGYGGGRRSRDVLHDIDLSVPAGQTLGIVGESGSGKSTLARALVGQLRPSAGKILLGDVEISALRGRRLRENRRRIQLIPQDPYASLDPRMTIRRALYEAIDPQGRRPAQAAARISELLATVSLDPDVASRYPHEFSGGQRQRIAIARALAVQPEVIIADEVTSALDSSVQAEVLNLLRSIQARTAITMLFITHDLSVANYMCDEVAVLYLGRLVEKGSSRLLFSPDHPYTRRLVDSIPNPRAGLSGLSAPEITGGEGADPANPPAGCAFHPRCPNGPRLRDDRERCITERPELLPRWDDTGDGDHRSAACHFPLSEVRAGLGD